MSEFYSRVASASLKKESTANTPVTPDTFFNFISESIATNYQYSPVMSVVGNRAKNINAVKNVTTAPAGTITMNVEPLKFGHFLNGIFCGVTSGNYLPMTSASAAFTVGETITGGSSGTTATVVVSDTELNYLLVSSPSADFTDGETITGGSSGSTATLTAFDASVYGHQGTLPDSTLPTYSLQLNYSENAIRFFGVRFSGLANLNQQENVITAEVQVMAKGQFRHAYVTDAVTSGAGSKTITVDQTLGLVASDTIKVFRPGTGFLDFSASSVKTHTIGAVTNSTQFTVTNLQTSLQAGDLVMLAPQTATYTVGDEFVWAGGSDYSYGADLDTLTTDCSEDFNFVLSNELEERHGACGTDFEDLLPTAILQKGFEASGQFTRYYDGEGKYARLRRSMDTAVKFDTYGATIAGGIKNQLSLSFANVQFDPYETNIATDDIVNEEVPFTSFYNATKGFSVKALLVNSVSSY